MTEFNLKPEFENLIKVTLADQEQQNQTKEITTVLEKNHDKLAKSPDFFQDNNVIKKKLISKSYATTWIKSRNFLLNISYLGINKENFYNKNFVFYI